MKSTNRIVAVLSIVLLVGGLVVATANAQLANQKTYFPFAREVELPHSEDSLLFGCGPARHQSVVRRFSSRGRQTRPLWRLS